MPKLTVLLLALGFILAPAIASADATSLTQAQGTPAGLTGPASDSSLGPASSNAQTGSSSADSASLQPAGTSPLQSTTSDSTGLTAPDSSTLQAPATSNDSLQVLSGDADGSPHQISGSSQLWLWLGFSLLFGLIAAAVVWFWRRRQMSQVLPAAAPAPRQAEPTTSQRLNITINRPAGEVFQFLLNPANTPSWIDAITEEQASDHPTKVGTVYRNRDAGGHWTEYEVTALSVGESFELTNHTNGYHVRYKLSPVGDEVTELEYYEFVDDGFLDHPFTNADLEKLKTAIEPAQIDSKSAPKS